MYGGKLRTKPVVIMRPQGHSQTGPSVYACDYERMCMCVCARPSDLGPQPLSPESTTSILQLPASSANMSGHTHTLTNTQRYTHAFRDMIQGKHFEGDYFVILLVTLCSTEITEFG